MAHTSNIIIRNADAEVADAYLEQALENNSTAWGAAFAADGVLSVAKGEGPTKETVSETPNETEVIFSFAGIDSALNLDDVSPHILIGNADKPVLVGFIDANVPGYAKADSSHPPEFFYAMEYLVPELQEMYNLVDNDIDKLTLNLAKPHYKKKLLQGVVSRGVLTLLACNGKIMTYAVADNKAEYEWGFVSNNFNYAVAGPVEPKKEEPSRGAFAKRSTTREPAPAAAIAAQQTTSSAQVAGKNATQTAVNQKYGVRKEKPGSHLARNDKQQWYKVRFGFKPRKWAEGIEVEVYYDIATGKTLTHTQVKQLGLEAMGLPKLNNPQQEKDTEPDHVTSPPTENGPAVADKFLPIVSPVSREWVKTIHSEHVKKIIAENAVAIDDPKLIQEEETKFASWAQQLGYKSMDDFMTWSSDMYYQMCKEKPDAGATMLINLMLFYRKNHKRVEDNKVSERDKQELAAQELKPASRGAFAKRATG